MNKKKRRSMNDIYYPNGGQVLVEKEQQDIEKKKAKEREKRIRDNKKKRKEDDFDLETEKAIKMTNKNKIKKDKKFLIEENKKKHKKIKRNKRIKLFFKIIVFLGVIVGISAFAMTSPIFNIKSIEVLNNKVVPSDTIISLSNLQIDSNIFRFNKLDVKNKLKENPYIEDVKIYRNIPNKITMEIIEREAKYSLNFMGKYAHINSQGYILEISEDNKQFPILEGIHTNEEEIVPGQRLNEQDLDSIEDVIKIINSAKENDLDNKITSIDISDKNQYSIYMKDEGKKIYIGDNKNLSNKLLYAVAIMNKEKEKEGDIYVNGDLNNKFQPYFREKVSL